MGAPACSALANTGELSPSTTGRGPRTSSRWTTRTCSCCAARISGSESVVAGVAWALLTELSRRLRRADEKIGGLVLLDVPGRIARLLLDLAQEMGSDTIDKPLTHQTIAQMIGASRETVSRAMKDFQDANWVTVERRRITLADRPALEARAQAKL
jgi:CRP-like cAMP-binding protein